MMDGIGSTLVLGFDGFVLCWGLGVLTVERWRAPLALAFGLCDAAATACGAVFGSLVPKIFASDWPGLLALTVVAGAAVLALLTSRPALPQRGARAVFLLPLVASFDNLFAGMGLSRHELWADSCAMALVSTALAYAGLRLGAFSRHELGGLRAARSAS